jgi:hypothetical protein
MGKGKTGKWKLPVEAFLPPAAVVLLGNILWRLPDNSNDPLSMLGVFFLIAFLLPCSVAASVIWILCARFKKLSTVWKLAMGAAVSLSLFFLSVSL